jgi:lactocepin
MKFQLTQLGLIVGATLLVVGCNVTQAGPVVVRIDNIAVTPDRFTLLTSQAAELEIVVTTSRGDGGGMEQLVWSTTGGVITGNAIVGNVRRVTYQAPPAPGTYFLTVTTTTGAPRDSASFTVTNTIVPVSGIAVSPNNVTFVVGDTSRLRATLTDSTGAVLVGRPITWTSSDNGIVTVLATGQIRGMAAGSATITASQETHSASAVITVNP